MKRSWSDADRASALAALAANAGNVARTAREIGVPRNTLIDWREAAQGAESARMTDALTEIRHQKKGDLAARLEEIAYQLVDALPGKIGDASLREAAVAMAIAVDKMQLLREKPTAITRDDSLTDSERADRIAALVESARARRDGRPSPGAVAN